MSNEHTKCMDCKNLEPCPCTSVLRQSKKSKKKCIYLANAYSSKSLDKDFARFESTQRRILESYIGGQLKKKYNVTVILPIAMSAAMADICDFDTGFSTWADDDLNFISRSDEVWVLVSDGWDTSVGVTAEILHAQASGIPVKYIHKDSATVYDTLKQVKDHDRLPNTYIGCYLKNFDI